MLVATFGPTTGWVGKKITRDGEGFVLEGHGPISASAIMEYDLQGHLVWVNAGTRAWVGAKAKAAPAPRDGASSTATAPETASATSGSKTDAGSQLPPRRRTVLKRILLVAIALLVVANVVLLLALAGVFR
jgi:hypothetical protein